MTAIANGRCREHTPPRLAIVGFVFVAASLMLLDETLATSNRPTLAVCYGSLALGAYCTGLMCLIACLIGQSEGADLGLARWKLGPWTLLAYSLTFGIATLTWSGPQTGAAVEIAVSSVLRALWLVAVGVTAWVLGYCAGPGRPVLRVVTRMLHAGRGRFAAEVRSPAAPWLLYAIGIAARLAEAATTGRFGYVGDVASAVTTATGYGGILGALTICAPLAVAAAALQVFRERLPEARITLAVLFLVELAFGAAAGGKQSFIIAVLAVVIPFCAARRRLPKAALIAVILFFLVVVIPFNQAYRNVARQGSVTLTPGQAVAAAPGILRQTVTGHSVVAVVPDSIDYLGQRMRDIDPVAIILQRTPGQIRLQSPIKLIEGPVAEMVPRAIWPGKPLGVSGYLFSQEFFGLSSAIYTSTSDTLVGGLYWYGGWIPAIVGMFLVGCMVRLLDDVIDVRTDPHAIFLIVMLFPSLVRAEYDWQAITASIPANILIWVLAVALTFRVRRQA